MKRWHPHRWEAALARLERRIGRPLHWWEAERLRKLMLEQDSVQAMADAMRRGSKLTTFDLGEGKRALTWTIPEEAA